MGQIRAKASSMINDARNSNFGEICTRDNLDAIDDVNDRNNWKKVSLSSRRGGGEARETADVRGKASTTDAGICRESGDTGTACRK